MYTLDMDEDIDLISEKLGPTVAQVLLEGLPDGASAEWGVRRRVGRRYCHGTPQLGAPHGFEGKRRKIPVTDQLRFLIHSRMASSVVGADLCMKVACPVSVGTVISVLALP